MSIAKGFVQMVVDTPPRCTTEDPELFFPIGWGDEHTFQIKQAKAVCRKCPLMAGCLEFALETGDGHAILAATTPAERDVIRRRRAERRERRAA